MLGDEMEVPDKSFEYGASPVLGSQGVPYIIHVT
jgi:hypothetical protein